MRIFSLGRDPIIFYHTAVKQMHRAVGMLRKTRHRGLLRVGWVFTFAAAAYNLVRMRNLATAVGPAKA